MSHSLLPPAPHPKLAASPVGSVSDFQPLRTAGPCHAQRVLLAGQAFALAAEHGADRGRAHGSANRAGALHTPRGGAAATGLGSAIAELIGAQSQLFGPTGAARERRTVEMGTLHEMTRMAIVPILLRVLLSSHDLFLDSCCSTLFYTIWSYLLVDFSFQRVTGLHTDLHEEDFG